MSDNNLQAQSDNLKTALAYAELGWQIFPCWQIVDGVCACGTDCKSPGKHPISSLAPRGQDSATSDKAAITQWWTTNSDANIAIYLAGSGLCAIDIDPRNGGDYTIEDLESVYGPIESDVVQLTGGNGEHRLFLRPDGNLPGKLGKGVDVKLNGYIIAEPSNHISGGEYIWEASSNPLEGAVAGPLPDWIRSFSQTAAYVDDNSDAAINSGMTDDQYYDVVEALPFINADDRDTWLTVGMALHAANDKRAYQLWCDWSATSDKFDQNDQYRVWRSFRHKGLSSVDLPTLFKLAQDSGWINTKQGNLVAQAIDISEPVKLSKHGNKQAVPSHLLDIPVPQLSEVMHWMESHSRQPQREISIAATLALASVLAGRNYRSEEANTSSMYFMILADTGVGKNYAKTTIQSFLVESKLDHLLSGSGNTSAGAVFTALCRAPCHIQIADEVGKQLQTARKQVNGQMAEAFSTLTEAYSSTTSYMIPRNYSNMGDITKGKNIEDKKVVVHCPAITNLGLATSGQVFDNLTTAEIEDGFLNRLHVVEVSEPQAPRQRSRRLPVPEHLKEWAFDIRHPKPKSRTDLSGIEAAYDVTPVPTIVAIDDAAMMIFDGLFDALAEAEEEGKFTLPDLTRRWVENSMRLATALAVCENSKDPIVNAEIAGWCVDYVTFYGQRFMDSAATRVADGEFHRLYLNIYELIGRSGSKGMTERDLSTYSRLFAASRPNDREQAFKALLSESRIMQVAIPSVSGRGRKRVAYICPENFDETIMEVG
ncbi:bifunctional DNA primase/polymerase [Psychrobacter pygoscelis]|uniref:bifunctional DNA primase/polymerase n=1 Tax=Psychrobacter pygoscelis TaxID=2488563 RepID=UPI00103F4E63|nr:bifunctional DNA primase/polymerase [Psychrobacter pygoscelis]